MGEPRRRRREPAETPLRLQHVRPQHTTAPMTLAIRSPGREPRTRTRRGRSNRLHAAERRTDEPAMHDTIYEPGIMGRRIGVRITPKSLAPRVLDALRALGYTMIELDSDRWTQAARDGCGLWLVDDERLAELPDLEEAADRRILLIASARKIACTDPRIFASTRRPARLGAVYEMIQSALESTPRSAPRVRTQLSARCIQRRAAIDRCGAVPVGGRLPAALGREAVAGSPIEPPVRPPELRLDLDAGRVSLCAGERFGTCLLRVERRHSTHHRAFRDLAAGIGRSRPIAVPNGKRLTVGLSDHAEPARGPARRLPPSSQRPRKTTASGSRRTSSASVGSARSTTRSAERPGAMRPVSCATPRASAASAVAARSRSTGRIPAKACRARSPLASSWWKTPGMPASVDARKRTPWSRCRPRQCDIRRKNSVGVPAASETRRSQPEFTVGETQVPVAASSRMSASSRSLPNALGTREGRVLDRPHAGAQGSGDPRRSVAVGRDRTTATARRGDDRRERGVIELGVAGATAGREDAARRHHLDPVAARLRAGVRRRARARTSSSRRRPRRRSGHPGS